MNTVLTRQITLTLLMTCITALTFAQPVTGNPQPIRMNATSPATDSLVLVVINGQVAGTLKQIGGQLDKIIDPNRISQVNVWKGDSAIARYGQQGSHGVIDILTKDAIITHAVNEKNEKADVVFERVETESNFPGGPAAWRKYLERNLNGNIPEENHAPPGTYTVYVEFVVDKDGSISNIRPLTQHGFGMEEELMRVIGKGPAWEPAQQNGRKVKAYRKQPVTFVVNGEFELSAYKIPAGTATPISITTASVKPENMKVTLSRGNVRQQGTGNLFVLFVDTPGPVLLTLWEKKNKKEFEIGKVWVQVN